MVRACAPDLQSLKLAALVIRPTTPGVHDLFPYQLHFRNISDGSVCAYCELSASEVARFSSQDNLLLLEALIVLSDIGHHLSI